MQEYPFMYEKTIWDILVVKKIFKSNKLANCEQSFVKLGRTAWLRQCTPEICSQVIVTCVVCIGIGIANCHNIAL